MVDQNMDWLVVSQEEKGYGNDFRKFHEAFWSLKPKKLY